MSVTRAPLRVEEPIVAEPADVVARVPEAAIQDAWVRGLFTADRLRTTDGEPVRLRARGRLNRDSGPDVADARVEICGVLWAGDIEIHRTSSEWTDHGHHTDSAYERVVLHVVLAADRQTGTLRRSDGSALPELVLLPHLDRSLGALLREFYVEPRDAPHCGPRWRHVSTDVAGDWVRRLGLERLWERARALGHAYGRRPDLDRILIGRVFRALGYAPNADAMEDLARRLPLSAVRRLVPADVHALLLCLSGLDEGIDLFAFGDDLADRAEALKGPLGLRPMRPEAWRRGSRPANAPRRRIAQAAALLAPGGALHSDAVARLGEALKRRTAIEMLRPSTPDGSPVLGRERAETVLIDAVLPVLLLAAEQREDPDLEATVVEAFERIPAHSDRITRRFAEVGFPPRTAREAQGLHQLARAYCDDGRCARCAVGLALYPGLRLAGDARS